MRLGIQLCRIVLGLGTPSHGPSSFIIQNDGCDLRISRSLCRDPLRQKREGTAGCETLGPALATIVSGKEMMMNLSSYTLFSAGALASTNSGTLPGFRMQKDAAVNVVPTSIETSKSCDSPA
jgi:hypothetical protein